MRKLHTAVATAAAACALLLVGGAGSAAAQDTMPFAKSVPVTGQTKSGKKFTGTYTIKKFVQRNGKAVAVGTLKGKLKHRNVPAHRRADAGEHRAARVDEAAADPDARAPARC